ncbi:hypothetical protein GGF47_002524 [Coemansia sp. RSA 2524]|nr:hypothetical protein GGF47_002524 [Coemansia sp. RSA 2524]
MFGRDPNAFTDNCHSEPLDEEASSAQVADLKERALQMSSGLFPMIAQRTAGTTAKQQQQFQEANKLAQLTPGAAVMIRGKRNHKLEEKHPGPYQIAVEVNPGTFKLKDLTGEQLARNYVTSQLIPLSDGANFDDVHQEVLAIKGHRNTRGGIRYRVLWKDGDESWIPASSFNSLEIVHEYWDKLGTTAPADGG